MNNEELGQFVKKSALAHKADREMKRDTLPRMSLY